MGRQNNKFSVRRLCTSLCDLPSSISLTIFSRKCRGIRPRRTAAICTTIWPSVQKAFKILPAFCFQKFSSDLLSKSFQKFSSDLLSKIFQRLAFKKLSKFFQRLAFKIFPAISFQKAFKIFPAISFQKFSSDLLSKF